MAETSYIGTSEPEHCEYEVRICNGSTVLPLPLHLDKVNHSPTGFSWGYAGSGPAQLAFALLFDATGDEAVARRLYMSYKAEVVARLPKDWQIPISRVRRWATLRTQQEEAMGPRPESECIASIFRHHNCWRCNNGAEPCFEGDHDRCSYPQARND